MALPDPFWLTISELRDRVATHCKVTPAEAETRLLRAWSNFELIFIDACGERVNPDGEVASEWDWDAGAVVLRSRFNVSTHQDVRVEAAILAEWLARESIDDAVRRIEQIRRGQEQGRSLSRGGAPVSRDSSLTLSSGAVLPNEADPDQIFGTGLWLDPLRWPTDRTLAVGGWSAPYVFFGNAVDRVAKHAPTDKRGNIARLWAAELIIDWRIAENLKTRFHLGGEATDIGTEEWRRARRRGECLNPFANCGVQLTDLRWLRLFVDAFGLRQLEERAAQFAFAHKQDAGRMEGNEPAG